MLLLLWYFLIARGNETNSGSNFKNALMASLSFIDTELCILYCLHKSNLSGT